MGRKGMEPSPPGRNPRASSNRECPMRAIVLSLVAATLAGGSSHAPDAGHEVVLIKKPWFFGHGGVVEQPVKTGRTFTAITTDGIDVYMQPQKYEADLKDTMTNDGV